MKNISIICIMLLISLSMIVSERVHAQWGRYPVYANAIGNQQLAKYMREEAKRIKSEAINKNIVIRSILKSDFKKALELITESENNMLDANITMQKLLLAPRDTKNKRSEHERLELAEHLLNNIASAGKEINLNKSFEIEKGVFSATSETNLIAEALNNHHFEIAQMMAEHPHYDIVQVNSDKWTPELLAAQNFPDNQERGLEKFLMTLLQKGSSVNASTPALFNFFSKDINTVLEERGFINLARKVRNFLTPDQFAECPRADVVSHLRLIREVDKVSCAICLEDLKKGEVAIRSPAGCSCKGLSCVPCMKTYIKYAADESGVKIPTCPFANCRKELERSLLDSLKTRPEEKRKILAGVLEQRLRSNPHYKQCKTSECRKYFFINPDKKEWMKCPLCSKESFLEGANVASTNPKDFNTDELEKEGREEPPMAREDKDIRGLYRRCYFCKVLTCRYDGCNSISCLNCKRDWDFNYGDPKNHPNYRVGKPPVHDYQRMPQQF